MGVGDRHGELILGEDGDILLRSFSFLLSRVRRRRFLCYRDRRSSDSEQAYQSWLVPIAEVTAADGARGFDLPDYLQLVEATGQLTRGDKRGAIDAGLPAILTRLDASFDLDSWSASVAKPHGLGGAALGTMVSLAKEAARRGLKWMQRRSALFPVQPVLS